MGTRRAGTTAVVAVVATTLLIVVLATWASSIGPNHVLRGKGMGPLGPAPTQTGSEEAPASDTGVAHPEIHQASWVRDAAFLVDLLLLTLLLLLFVRYVLIPLFRRARSRRLRRRSAADREDTGFAVLEEPQRVARALLDDAADQRRLLVEGGTPRNAVVECWSRFETAAAAAGLARRPWETSSEYTIRVLDLVDAYEPAVSRLADLYREARFSEHELTEADRAAALEALDTIHRTIGVPV